jgi:DHA1 family multidrug resistance protein-like MFS transporter
VFVEIYGFNLGEEGLAYLGILVGAFVVLPPFFLYLYKVLEPQFDDEGNIAPEKRLPPACVGAFFIPICLFWFGWSSGHVHWIMPIIGSAFFSIGAVLLFNSVLNYLPDAYPDDAASVLAGNDFMRSAFGAGFPLFARAMVCIGVSLGMKLELMPASQYNNLGVGWASSLLGFLSIAFIPIPFGLYYVRPKFPCLVNLLFMLIYIRSTAKHLGRITLDTLARIFDRSLHREYMYV